MIRLAHVVRWAGIVPLTLLVALLAVGGLLLLDPLVERGVEDAGTHLVGARVDVEEADVRLAEGAVALRGLAITNPTAPMRNLLEARELVANLRLEPLLEKKVVVETLAVRGVRFGTARQRSGALRNPSPESGRILREIRAWEERMRIPTLSLEGLQSVVVDPQAIDPDSLRALGAVRDVQRDADSMRGRWEAELAALDPRPVVDSARAWVERLRETRPAALDVLGATRLAASARTTLQTTTGLAGRLGALDSTARLGVADLEGRARRLDAAREADLEYARRLLRLPDLGGPDVSPAVFGEAAVAWVRPLLYWARIAERYLPPGLDPRRFSGPDRARRSGTTVTFPGRAAYPRFLLEHGELDLTLGGEGPEAGRYTAVLGGVTSAPALSGRPIEVRVGRVGTAGPNLRLAATLDHAAEPVRDSVSAGVDRVTLPDVTLPALGARLRLGEGSGELSLRRRGEEIAARLRWRSSAVTWERIAGEPAADAPIGSAAWLEALVWRTVSGIRQVEIDVRLAGPVSGPALGVSSNVGTAIAGSLRRTVGRELEAAERSVQAELDRLVGPQLAAASERIAALRAGPAAAITARLGEVRGVERELRREIDRLTGGLSIP